MIRRRGRARPSEPVIEHDDEVPEHVLDELLSAFGEPEQSTVEGVDFDDPSIDALLAPTIPASGAPSGGSSGSIETAVLDSSADRSATTVLQASPGRRPTIRIGGDDELPDAVYLDEDAELRLRAVHGTTETAADDGEERSTIVIGDVDESQPAIEQLPDRTSGGMDPRLRARRVAVGRAKGRRRLILAGIVAAVVLLVLGGVAVLASGLFAVDQVNWQGAVYTDEALRAQVDEDLKGTPVLLVDTDEIERRLEANPWVDEARVDTDFPHTVNIDVRERQPVAAFQGGTDGQWRIIDRDGRVVAVIPDTPDPAAYVWITGQHPDVELGAFAGPLYAAAAQLWVAVPPEIRAITESLGVDPAAGSLSIELRRPEGSVGDATVQVRLGDPSDMPAKLARLLQIVRRGLDTTIPIDVSATDVGVVTT